jgi:N-acetylmuramoyl-L-alanine amidase
VTAGAEGAAFSLALPRALAFRVEEGERALVLTLYGAGGGLDVVRLAPADTLVRAVEWAQDAADRLRITLRLAAAPYGWSAGWSDGQLLLRVRRPPAVSRRAPLRGLTVAVDAGHPPQGATGPTGLREAEVTLDVARRLRALLVARGARVVMTRDAAGPVSLEERVRAAERAGVHALVSIHADAPPPGAEPYAAAGASTRFFHPHALPLARAVQAGVAARLGVADRGVAFQDLALARPSWFPAVLCEGATLALPEHEAALRAPGFRQAYARGVADGLERYFRALGGG